MLAKSLLAILVVLACERLPRELTAAGQSPADVPVQCVRDDDCVMLPSALTCCIECPPAPPFEPAPAWVLDGILIENETECADVLSCVPMRCDPVPRGCVARAACEGGRCIAVTSDCGRPTS